MLRFSYFQSLSVSKLSFNRRKLQSSEEDDNGGSKNSSDLQYNAWLVQHPSALASFDQMMKAANGKKLVIFLDYDGTLSPIVNDPNRAFMSDEMRAAVQQVAKCFPTAIISGRSIDKVKEFVQLDSVYYAGSHGMDIMVPPPKSSKPSDGKHRSTYLDQEGDEAMFQPAKKFLPAMQEMYRLLEETTMKIEGAMVEDNRFCVSVHFRQVKEEVMSRRRNNLFLSDFGVDCHNLSSDTTVDDLEAFSPEKLVQEDYGKLEERVNAVVERYPQFKLSQGKKVMEIRPAIEWDKGHALEYFLRTLGLSNSSDVIPLYIGDDRTDEDAFKVIRRREKGYPIIVTSTAMETKALFSLKEPSEVMSFLLRLARWRKLSSSSNSTKSLSQVWGIGN